MSMSIDMHVHTADVVCAAQLSGSEVIYLEVRDANDNTITLYFPDARAVRVFLGKALNELRQVEAGGIPFNTHKDSVEVTV